MAPPRQTLTARNATQGTCSDLYWCRPCSYLATDEEGDSALPGGFQALSAYPQLHATHAPLNMKVGRLGPLTVNQVTLSPGVSLLSDR